MLKTVIWHHYDHDHYDHNDQDNHAHQDDLATMITRDDTARRQQEITTDPRRPSRHNGQFFPTI